MALEFKSELGKKLALYTILCSSVLTILTTTAQLSSEYRDEASKLEKSLNLIEDSFVRSLKEALWTYNSRQTNLIIEGIKSFPYIQYVEVSYDTKHKFKKGTLKTGRGYENRTYDIKYQFSGGSSVVGTMTIQISWRDVYDKLLGRVFIIIFGNLIKTFIVGLFILYPHG